MGNGGWNRVGLYGKFDYEGLPEDWASGYPDPDSDPVKPEPTTATVTAATGKTVNIRKTKSISGKLVERVPIGSTVTVLRTEGNWSRVAYTDPSGAVWCGWMVSGFLKANHEEEGECSENEDAPYAGTPLYAVTIPFLTEENARALLRTYSGAWMTKEEY